MEKIAKPAKMLVTASRITTISVSLHVTLQPQIANSVPGRLKFSQMREFKDIMSQIQ